MINKLVVKEFEVGVNEVPEIARPGYGYSFFQDPETGKWYRPRATFQVTGENLEELFIEIETS